MPSRFSPAVLLTVAAALLVGAPAAHAATVTTPTSTVLPAAIADGTAGLPPAYGATTTLSFPVTGLPNAPITDVRVSLTGSHAFVGDLDVVLAAPSGGPTQTIFSRTGATTAGAVGSGADFTGPYTFSDSAPATPTWWGAAAANAGTAIPAGTYPASQPGGAGATGANTLITPTFATTTANGTWEIRVRDASSPVTGNITAASLVVRTKDISTLTPATLEPSVGLGDRLPFVAETDLGDTGTFTYNVYGPDNPGCSGTPVFTTTAPTSGGATATAMPDFVPSAQGVYRLKASYSGDANTTPSSSTCNQAGTRITVGPPFVTFDSVTGQSLGSGSTKTPNGRPFRGGVASYCGGQNVPSTSGAGTYAYLAFNHRNAALTANCVRAQVKTTCPIPGIFVQSYSAPFDPATLNANYLGDAGTSGLTQDSYFSAGGGLSFTDVVFESALGVGCAAFDVTWQATHPWNTALPSVPGTPQVSVNVAANPGTWNGDASFGYRWRRCETDGVTCSAIPGAGDRTYAPVAADLGKRLVARVTASFDDQASVVDSTPSAPVAAAPIPPIAVPTPAPTTTIPVITTAKLTIGAVTQTAKTWRAGKLAASIAAATKPTGTTFGLTLSRPAKVTLTFAKQTKGRKVGAKCVAPTKANAKKPSCTLGKAAGTLSLTAAKGGAVRVKFQGRLGTKTLASGTYSLIVTATDKGETATAKAVTFTIVK